MEIEPGKTRLTVHEAHAIQVLTAEFNCNAIWEPVDRATELWFITAINMPIEAVPVHPVEVELNDAKLEQIRQLGVRVLRHTKQRVDALAAAFSELDIDGASDSDGLISKMRECLSSQVESSAEPEPDSTQLLGSIIRTIEDYQGGSNTVARNTA